MDTLDAPGGGPGTGPGGRRGEGDGCYRFGDYMVDASAHVLTRSGQPQALEPKAFAVLLHLLRHAGELVRHGDLLDAVWGHRHVTPGVLTRAIAQLRHVLEDDSQHPRYIQTQHGLGYRFVGELALAAGPGAASTAPGAMGGEAAPDGAEARAAPAGDTHRPQDTTGGDGASVGIPLATGGEAASDPLAVAAAAAEAPAPAARPQSPRRRPWLAVALLAGVTALVALAWRERPLLPRSADASIAVLPFTSLSDDRNDSYFAQGLAVELHDALAGIPGLKVAACRPDSACATRGADARRIGRLLGVATLLDAQVRREGQRVRVNARLSDAGTGYTLWSGSYDRELGGVFDLQREIAEEVVDSLPGIGTADSREALARRLQPTRNVAAYDAYLKGKQQLDQRHDSRAAIGFFSEALAADAGFARAQAGICRGEIVNFEAEKNAAAYDRARQACGKAAQMDPQLREVNLALGDLHQARGDSAQALGYYRQALEDTALRPDAYLGMARAEAAMDDNAAALAHFEQARQLRPGDAAIHRALGYHHYVTGRLDKALETYRVATELQPNDEETLASYGGLCLLAGDKACANDALMRSLSIRPSSYALVNLGNLRFDAGDYPGAAALFRRATDLDAADYRTWGNLGDALAATPATAAQAREPYRRAAELAQAYVDIKPQDAHAIATLAWYRANLGDAPAARELLARAERLDAEPGEVAFWSAQSLALLGDETAARERVRRALAGGIERERLTAAPVLRRLVAAESTQAPAQ